MDFFFSNVRRGSEYFLSDNNIIDVLSDGTSKSSVALLVEINTLISNVWVAREKWVYVKKWDKEKREFTVSVSMNDEFVEKVVLYENVIDIKKTM